MYFMFIFISTLPQQMLRSVEIRLKDLPGGAGRRNDVEMKNLKKNQSTYYI